MDAITRFYLWAVFISAGLVVGLCGLYVLCYVLYSDFYKKRFVGRGKRGSKP